MTESSKAQAATTHSVESPAMPDLLAASRLHQSGPSIGRKKKVLFFYQDFGAMGGIERYLCQVGQWLAEQDEIEPVFACCENTPLFHQLQSLGLPVLGLPSHPLFGRSFLRSLDIRTFLRLKAIIRQEKPEIVHVNIGLLETLLFQRWGCAVVYSFHGYGTLFSGQGSGSKSQRGPKAWFKNLTKRLFQKTAAGLDALLFVSHAEQQRMLAEGYLQEADKGRVLHNGLPIEELQHKARQADCEALRKMFGISQTARCVSFINRLDENKNPLQFIELARRLRNQPELGELVFLMAGDGPLQAAVREACASESDIHYLGYRPDVANILALSDLLVYPARREGFGLGLVEAMAVGVPCVAYASEGSSEILNTPGTHCCLAPVDVLDSLTQTAKQFLMLGPNEKERLVLALRQRASQFNRQHFIEALTQVYHHLTPTVSVILPVHNGSYMVERAIQSVLTQDYPHLELIVVDDGSADDTAQRVARIPDARLKLVIQENQGVAQARNNGFQHASGDYIAFIDADDVWLPQKLSEELRVIRRHSLNTPNPECLIYSGYYAVDERDRLINRPSPYKLSGDLSAAVLEHEGIFLPSTALVHRGVFEAVGGFKPDCYHEDRVFFIEACQRFPAYPTGQRLTVYRQSLSGRCRSVLKQYLSAVDAELSIVTTLRHSLSEAQLKALSIRQLRNLLYRFLMYNYREQAQQLYGEIQRQHPNPGELFRGQKGQLAMSSLYLGINGLALARECVQLMTRLIPVRWAIHRLPKAGLTLKQTPKL